jgi:large subunit ribosomal protein L24
MSHPKSKKPRKQRKFLYTVPLHLKRKMLASHLSKVLREKYKKRSMPIRKGDEVLVMRGKFKGKTGKISRIDMKSLRVYIDGVSRKRTIGTEVQVPVYPSNLQITNLTLDDKRRVKILERKGVKNG